MIDNTKTWHVRAENAKERRATVVEKLMFDWIGQSGPETGIMVKEPDSRFADLKREVEQFRSFGNGKGWTDAVNRSLLEIDNAFEEFLGYAGLARDAIEGKDLWEKDIDYFSFELRKDYARLVKHAVYMTCFHCHNV